MASQKQNDEWKTVDDPETPEDDRDVLACALGQFSWFYFIARAFPRTHGGVQAQGHAKPTHWMHLPKPPKSTG